MSSGGGGGLVQGPKHLRIAKQVPRTQVCTVVVVAGAELGVGYDVGVLVSCGTAGVVCRRTVARVLRRPAWGALRCMHCPVARVQPDAVHRQWADICHSLCQTVPVG